MTLKVLSVAVGYQSRKYVLRCKRAGEPECATQLVSNGVIPAVYLRGQAPEPIRDAPDSARVVTMRHCGDGYTIETADGAHAVYWEKIIRLKIDSTETGIRRDSQRWHAGRSPFRHLRQSSRPRTPRVGKL